MTTTALEQELLRTDAYVCVNPEIGQYLRQYVDGRLSDSQYQEFSDHLVFCLKCQEEVAYIRWVIDTLQSHPKRIDRRLFEHIADTISYWEPIELVAAEGMPKHIFDVEDGRIKMECDWDRPRHTRAAYIWVSWDAQIRSERELTLRFIRPETGETLYSVSLGMIRAGEMSLKTEELGFDPSQTRWAIIIG